MKVFKFPDVNRETWDGSNLKKKHLSYLADDPKHQAKVDAAKRLISSLERNLDLTEIKVVKLKAELKKAKTDYYRLLEVKDDEG